jgi:hypothetical protein
VLAGDYFFASTASGGSQPVDAITSLAEAVVMKRTKSRAIVSVDDADITAAAYVVWFCTARGSGPTSLTPFGSFARISLIVAKEMSFPVPCANRASARAALGVWAAFP